MAKRIDQPTRPDVVFQIGPWQALPSRQLTEANNLRASFSLNEYNECSFNVALPLTRAVSMGEGRSDVYVWRNGVKLGRFRVCRPTIRFAERFSGEVIARDYRWLMGLRPLRGAFNYASPTDQATIIWDIFSNGQSWGDLGITQAPGWAATGVTRSNVGVVDGDYAWDSIKKIAALDNGCEPYINPDQTLSLNYPRMGSDKGVSLDFIATEFGTYGAIAELELVIDYEKYGNALRIFGATGTTPVETSVPFLSNQPEGVWPAIVRDDAYTTNQMISAAAAGLLDQNSTVFPEHRITLREGFWQGPSHIWLGDTINQVVKAGDYNLNRKARVYNINLSWGANGKETVELVLTKNSPTGERKISEALKKLRALG